MQASCASWSVPAGRLILVASYVPVHGHPGTAGLKRVAVVPSGNRSSPEALVMLAHAPLLVLGDHSFVYTRTPGAMSEPGRALRACAGAKRSGTYRADSGDVGVCLRTGWRRATYEMRQVEGGGIECVLVDAEEDDDDPTEV